MRCYCCDKELSDREVIYNPELPGYEMCNTCLDVSMEAAYGQFYSFNGDNTDPVDPDFDALDILDIGDASDIIPKDV